MRLLIVVCMFLVAGCSQNSLLTKQHYQKSQQEFARGDNEKALLDFPRGREERTFITTMEKGYLSLLQGKPQLAALQAQAAWQENQVRYHVSREARTFFYVQTPEDYYPSEHEVIWLHFLLGWGYAMQGKYADSCVEARVASSLLTLPWSPAGHFDDPTMRLFLASLWTMCGEWREAQVDFRAAWFMDNSLTWAKELAERDKPPAQLFMVLGGPGPDVVWNPELRANPLRSGRQVSFRLRGRKSALTITDQRGVAVTTHLSPDANRWYERHLARESELHELIQDSAYGGKAVASGAKATAIFAGDTAEGLVEGIVAGALVGVYIVAKADMSTPNTGSANTTGSTSMTAADYQGAAIIGAALGGVIGGIVGAVQGYEEGTAQAKKDLDPSPYYRYVRYLPEYLWVGWSERPVDYPVRFSTPASTIEVKQPSVVKRTAVTVAQLPDVYPGDFFDAVPRGGSVTTPGPNRGAVPAPCVYREKTPDGSSTTILTKPDANGNCPAQPDL